MNKKLDFSDVLIAPNYSTLTTRKDVNLNRTFNFLNGHSIQTVPIVASNMATVGTFSMATELSKLNLMTCLHKHYPISKILEFIPTMPINNTFITIGITEEDKDKIKHIHNTTKINNEHFLLCIDVANGYMDKMVETIAGYRTVYPKAVICAGNVVTPEMVLKYYNAGADIIKIGLGNGKMCLTRNKTGIGYPQLSAILECFSLSSTLNKCYIMSDGGCLCAGDISKAFVGGADFVMLGSMLAGHDECELNFETDEYGNKYSYVYGMSSSHAMEKHNGGMKEYRSSEGRVTKVQPKGPVKDTVMDILGGIRSCGTYLGCSELNQFKYKAENFILVNQQHPSNFGD